MLILLEGGGVFRRFCIWFGRDGVGKGGRVGEELKLFWLLVVDVVEKVGEFGVGDCD